MKKEKTNFFVALIRLYKSTLGFEKGIVAPALLQGVKKNIAFHKFMVWMFIGILHTAYAIMQHLNLDVIYTNIAVFFFLNLIIAVRYLKSTTDLYFYPKKLIISIINLR